MKNSIYMFFAVILISSILVAGCDVLQSDSDTGPAEVQLQMQVQTTALSTTGQLMAGQQLNDYEFQEVKLFIDEMELESVSDDSSDFEEGGFIVDMPLDGSPINISERAILPGLYDEFELEIERPDDDDSITDPDFRVDDRNYSVVVKGLYKGEEFTYKSNKDFEIEMDLNPPLEVSESESTALVIDIDINSWFKESNGNDLDPNDSNNFERIDENIENSFEGYEEEEDDDDKCIALLTPKQ